MTLKTRLFPGLLAVLVLIVAISCQKVDQAHSGEQHLDAVSSLQHPTTNETQGNGVTSEAIIEPVIIAEGATELNGNKTQETIRVWLMNGKEVTDPNPGAFEGTFLQGQFEMVATANDGTELARFGLNDAFDGGELSFRKDKPFMLQFDDYNGDGYPDFAVGQWGSSNGNIYSLLTINPNGFSILAKDIYSADHRGSIRFRKVGDHAFVNQYYDQLKGSLDVIYRWKDGAFSKDAPIGANENITLTFQSVNNEQPMSIYRLFLPIFCDICNRLSPILARVNILFLTRY
jgi:hypothetical protein